eukprot:TRINITY_DN4131_c0_g2_i7.p1 TRINITY_DN4131_c0_g2~~TRINITY_DN4131_c0_g2_i7.p1  ORF type:complete len:410 (-),score=113.26 TRINITY_DN4131_c0_g2_i7:309-1538(-)
MNKCVSRRLGGEITLGPKLNTEGISKLRVGYKDGKEYAVKYAKVTALNKPEYVHRLLSNEVEALSSLNDPKVMKIYGHSYSALYVKEYVDHSTETEVAYCLMSRETQWNLMDIIYFSKPFNEKLGRFYFRQLLSAVRYIHEAGYAHRNLKLNNILLDHNYNLVLSNFTYSKRLSLFSKEVEEHLSRESSMCPESLQSITCSPVMDDLFSLGYILFTALFKSPPFRKAVPTDTHYRLICDHRLEDFWKQFAAVKVSDSAKDLISSVLAYEPIFRLSLDEIESAPWVQDEVPTLEQVQKEVSELVKTTDQKGKEQALNRKKNRLKNSMCKGIPAYYVGHSIKTRGLEVDALFGSEAINKKLLEESKVLPSTHLYTMEDPIIIEDALNSYLVSAASSFKIDERKYKVSLALA